MYVVPLEALLLPQLAIISLPAPQIELGAEGVTPAPSSGSQLDHSKSFAPLVGDRVLSAVSHATALYTAAKGSPFLVAARKELVAVFRELLSSPNGSRGMKSVPSQGEAGCFAVVVEKAAAAAVATTTRSNRKEPPLPPVDLCHALLKSCVSRLLYETTLALGQGTQLLTAASLDTAALNVFSATCSRQGASVPCDISTLDSRFLSPSTAFHFGREEPPISFDPHTQSWHAFHPAPNNWYHAVLQETPSTSAAGSTVVVGGGGGGGVGGGGVEADAGTTTAGFMIVRAFQELEAREAALICHFKGLKGCARAASTFLTVKHSGTASLVGKSRDILTGLQFTFPSTLYNVVRTAQKLEQRGARQPSLCLFCGSITPVTVEHRRDVGGIIEEGVGERGVSLPTLCALCRYFPPRLWEGARVV